METRGSEIDETCVHAGRCLTGDVERDIPSAAARAWRRKALCGDNERGVRSVVGLSGDVPVSVSSHVIVLALANMLVSALVCGLLGEHKTACGAWAEACEG